MGGFLSKILKYCTSADEREEPNILSLPGDRLEDIGLRLSVQDQCSMELASKRFYETLSSPSRPGPSKYLYLGELGPEALRWYEKRIKAHKRISCDFDDATMLEREVANDGSSMDVLPPLLPSILATCASSAELTLSVFNGQGGNFLAMASGGIFPGLGPNTTTLWANMKQHLTDLHLRIRPRGGEVRYLDSLNMLSALKNLEINNDFPWFLQPDEIKLLVTPASSHKVLGETLTLKLPDLVSLDWQNVQPLQKELVLLCPKLAHAVFVGIKSVCIKVEHATLEYLALAGSNILFVVDNPEIQLQYLRSLNVDERSETGRLLIQDIDQRTNLEYLRYIGFSAACMPTTFPRSLREIELCPLGWSQGLPRGLKELHNLKEFHSKCKFWDNISLSNIKRPFKDLLPVDSLNKIRLGFNVYERQPDGPLQLTDGRLRDTPQGQYLAGLRPQPAPNAEESGGSQGLLELDFSLQQEQIFLAA